MGTVTIIDYYRGVLFSYSLHSWACARFVLNQNISYGVYFLLIQIIHTLLVCSTTQNTSLSQWAPSALASSGKLRGFISRGYQLSSHASYKYDPDDELDDEVTQALRRVGLNHEYDTAESATSSSTSVEAKSQWWQTASWTKDIV